MLSRPATKISLTPDDITAYEQRKLARDAARNPDIDSSQDTTQMTSENGDTPAITAQSKAAKAKQAKDARIGLGGGSRG